VVDLSGGVREVGERREGESDGGGDGGGGGGGGDGGGGGRTSISV
jgi:hypothetical protein